MFDNSDTLTIGSNETETITIEGNKIEGESTAYLLFNIAESTLNINGSNILIKDNIISNYYVIHNKGIININLYGDNPTFKMLENKTAEGNKKLTVDIYLYGTKSKLNFINNSDNEAIIELGNGIKGVGSVTFENRNGYNGSFTLKNIDLEASKINIESNVTLLLTINSEGLLGRLKGSYFFSNDPELNVNNGNKLIIEVNGQEDIKSIEDYYYTIISSFANLCDLVGRRQIVLRKNKIKIDNMTYKLNLYTYKGDFDKNKSEVKLGLTEITGEELKMKEEEAKIKKK